MTTRRPSSLVRLQTSILKNTHAIIKTGNNYAIVIAFNGGGYRIII